MLTMDERNQLFLAAHPDIRRKIRAEYRKAHPPVIVMAIKPKYAKAIYEGRKNWEFRRRRSGRRSTSTSRRQSPRSPDGSCSKRP